MTYCDLHLHSTASDGTTDPADIPRLAKAAGLAAIALTDHDTTAGLEACAAACKKQRIKFVPGIELSADPGSIDDGFLQRGTLHILGLFIRPNDPTLLAIHERLLEARQQRNPQIIEKLNDLGVKIEYDEVIAEAGGQVVGRPHIAQVLMKKGYVKSIQDAFKRYIGEGAAAYARKDRLAAAKAIDAIHAAGGLAILAHPVQLTCPTFGELSHAIVKLADLGLDGVETRHSDHTAADVERLEQLADELDLLTSGGSDYHGSRKSIELGSEQVPISVYERLRDACRSND